MFERFAQADATNAGQKGGTGLGLSIVKQIVERLDGKVSFADAPGGGTFFYVELPTWERAIAREAYLMSGAISAHSLPHEDSRSTTIVPEFDERPLHVNDDRDLLTGATHAR